MPDAQADTAPEPADVTRARLMEALANLIEQRGYGSIAVVDIVRVAHASKRTFYAQFANKQECYLAMLQTQTDSLIAQIRAAVDEDAPWPQQLRQAISAYVTSLANRPHIALSWIRDLPALGGSARPAQRRNYSELANLITELSTNAGFARAGLPPLTNAKAVVLLGGLRELAAQTVEDGLDLDSIVEPATDIAIAVLQSGATAG